MSITARETNKNKKVLRGGSPYSAPHGTSYSTQSLKETNKQFAALKRKQETC